MSASHYGWFSVANPPKKEGHYLVVLSNGEVSFASYKIRNGKPWWDCNPRAWCHSPISMRGGDWGPEATEIGKLFEAEGVTVPRCAQCYLYPLDPSQLDERFTCPRTGKVWYGRTLMEWCSYFRYRKG